MFTKLQPILSLMNQQKTCHISVINELLGMSCDTLRYYEKIGLLKNIMRTQGGVRCYTQDNVSRLVFIQRAKSMSFTLDEIRFLLCFRDNPTHSSVKARNLASMKVQSIETKIKQLETLQQELTTLLEL